MIHITKKKETDRNQPLLHEINLGEKHSIYIRTVMPGPCSALQSVNNFGNRLKCTTWTRHKCHLCVRNKCQTYYEK